MTTLRGDVLGALLAKTDQETAKELRRKVVVGREAGCARLCGSGIDRIRRSDPYGTRRLRQSKSFFTGLRSTKRSRWEISPVAIETGHDANVSQ